MARDRAVLEREPSRTRLGRRTYLQLAGGAAATTAVVGQAGATHGDFLTVDGRATTGSTRYELRVDGTVTTETGEAIDSGHVTGTIADWREDYRLEGSLEMLTVDGPATVTLNGAPVDPDSYGPARPHRLEIETEGPATYEASVDGAIVPPARDDAVVQVAERTVEGTLGRGVHRHRFAGALADVTVLDGEATVRVDGEPVDPLETTAAVLPHAVVVTGPGTYTITVDDGVLAPSHRAAADPAVIDGRTVSGSLEAGRHAYWFDGDLERLEVGGDATADVIADVHDR